MADMINWGIFKRHFWGELLRHQQHSSGSDQDGIVLLPELDATLAQRMAATA
jgi:hypothetical protein